MSNCAVSETGSDFQSIGARLATGLSEQPTNQRSIMATLYQPGNYYESGKYSMSEKEKMLNGKYYISWDNALVEEREKVKDLLFQLNSTRPSLRLERKEIISRLFGAVGKNPWVESPFNCDYGYNISVGDNFYTNTNCTILDCAEVTIGNDVLIGPNVSLYTPNHAVDAGERKEGFERALPITIGNNVWIGGSVTIIPGVTIGDNSIIGAGSVVTRNIPANVVAAGVPCRAIRSITTEDRIGLKRT